MPSAAEVRPEKWSEITVLFDNGEYSVISGVYERELCRLGERWNRADSELGFPNVAGYPVWHVIPDFLAVPILHGLLDKLARDQGNPRVEEYTTAIVRELRRLALGH